jgi:hypothetical protein
MMDDRERLTALLVAELGRAPVEALIDQTGVDWAGLAGRMTATKKDLQAELATAEPGSVREAELRHLLGLPPRPHGPGEEFKKLTDSLGLKEWEGCSCSAIQADMNRFGAAGCRKDRAKFIDRIKANVVAGIAAGKISKWAWVKAAYRAVRLGLALKIDPRDPIAGLFDLAVDNAAKKNSPGEVK